MNFYRKQNTLTADIIGRGGAWLDTGSMEDYYKTISFVSAVENRQGLKIACLEEIAFKNNFINKSQLQKLIKKLPNDYANYLRRLVD